MTVHRAEAVIIHNVFLKVFLEIMLQREGSLPEGNFPGSNFPIGTTFQGSFFLLGQISFWDRGHFFFRGNFPGDIFPAIKSNIFKQSKKQIFF